MASAERTWPYHHSRHPRQEAERCRKLEEEEGEREGTMAYLMRQSLAGRRSTTMVAAAIVTVFVLTGCGGAARETSKKSASHGIAEICGSVGTVLESFARHAFGAPPSGGKQALVVAAQESKRKLDEAMAELERFPTHVSPEKIEALRIGARSFGRFVPTGPSHGRAAYMQLYKHAGETCAALVGADDFPRGV
jgi:hypothetical protein